MKFSQIIVENKDTFHLSSEMEQVQQENTVPEGLDCQVPIHVAVRQKLLLK